MKARLAALLHALAQSFWLIPALLVAGGVAGAAALLEIDRRGGLPDALDPWLYDGGSTGARTLLGAVASSTIGVAGTVFSITVAALTLAAGQMGPRLLRSFTRDRTNQITLGVYLATFAYALTVLRSVRSETEAGGAFVPGLALSVALLLALACVALLVGFVAHIAGRINVDTVIGLVAEDLAAAIDRLGRAEPPPEPPPPDAWRDAAPVRDDRSGYLVQLDVAGLADWAAANQAAVRLLAGPGDAVFPGAAIALVAPPCAGAAQAIRAATAVGATRAAAVDLLVAARQLVEVAVRALSPGINDPNTAVTVIDRLAAALCRLALLHLDTGAVRRDGRTVLVVPVPDYETLLAEMFDPLRLYGAHNPAVAARMLDALAAVVECEGGALRVGALIRYADRIAADAEREIAAPDDRARVAARRRAFADVRRFGPTARA
ncbi:conserved membrane hypothetical protein [uncultured Alphaproteobacteria bacterium]|uniref:DUF2254 domain-containing protein n=1 Tax=uncultured Alphaproteobacteria bacterium TaxID=91750 RepID=A0A212K8T0_9PROT|nr:conserved membrane hypothetical protein [uncultured Alphaproteobacteria bacterium]